LQENQEHWYTEAGGKLQNPLEGIPHVANLGTGQDTGSQYHGRPFGPFGWLDLEGTQINPSPCPVNFRAKKDQEQRKNRHEIKNMGEFHPKMIIEHGNAEVEGKTDHAPDDLHFPLIPTDVSLGGMDEKHAHHAQNKQAYRRKEIPTTFVCQYDFGIALG
jgi:hypothetical protein